jgi:hypothetical protein
MVFAAYVPALIGSTLDELRLCSIWPGIGKDWLADMPVPKYCN